MPRDDEFRKVAEDIGALARSLGRDFREVVDQAMRGGSPPGRAVRHGLRGIKDEARRGIRTGFYGEPGSRHRRPWGPWGCGPGPGGWGQAPSAPPPGVPGGEPGAPGSESAGSPPGPPAPSWTRSRPSAGPTGGRGPAGVPWMGPSSYQPRRRRHALPPVRHRWDATTVVGLLAVLFGVAWLIGALGLLHVSIEGVVAVGLMLLGASLVVTGRTDWSLSRRSWPVWLGAGLIVILIATSTTFGVGGALSSVSFGDKTVATSLGGALPTGTVHGGFGNLTVDLSSATESGPVKVVSVAGNTFVKLPANANVTVNARILGGQICINGTDVADGVSAQKQQTVQNGVGGPKINLDVHQEFGQILIGTQGCAHRPSSNLPPAPPAPTPPSHS